MIEVPIHYSDRNFDLEEEGKCSLTFIGLRYTGRRSTYTVDQLRRNAAWPGTSPLQGGHKDSDGKRQPGNVQFGFVPDWTDDGVESRTIAYLERASNLEVLYKPKDIARAMLEKNTLPRSVFDRGYDPRLRERVFEAVGIEDEGARNVPGYREQLREIAEIDEDEDVEAARDTSRVGDYLNDHRRSELQDAAKALGKEDIHVGPVELATFLADQPADLARQALDDPDSVEVDEDDDDDLPDPSDLTVDEVKDVVGDLDTEDLSTLRDLETEGKDRSTALDAIDQRLDELKNDG